MKKWNGKLVALLAVLLLSAMVFTACGGNDQPADSEGEQEQQQAAYVVLEDALKPRNTASAGATKTSPWA